MAVVSIMAFSTGPATFAVDPTVKWHMAGYVFAAEAVLFLTFAAIVNFVIFRILCPSIHESIAFIQEQLVIMESSTMRAKLDNMLMIYDVVHSSGVKITVQYTMLGFCRLVMLVLPHWFVFFVWLDMVRGLALMVWGCVGFLWAK